MSGRERVAAAAPWLAVGTASTFGSTLLAVAAFRHQLYAVSDALVYPALGGVAALLVACIILEGSRDAK